MPTQPGILMCKYLEDWITVKKSHTKKNYGFVKGKSWFGSFKPSLITNIIRMNLYSYNEYNVYYNLTKP